MNFCYFLHIKYVPISTNVYTVEFQQREFHRVHLLLFLHPEDKHITPQKIVKNNYAKILDKETDLEGYLAIQNYMVHGSYRSMRKNALCMVDNM